MQNTTYRAPLELVEALGLTPAEPSNPYVPREAELVEYAKGLRNFPVPEQLTIDEAASVFDMWQNSKALHISTFCMLWIGDCTIANRLNSSRRRDVPVEVHGDGGEREGVCEEGDAADDCLVVCM